MTRPFLKFIGFHGAIFSSLLMLSACGTKDPDLDPQPTTPDSTSRQLPWNSPIPGQGGGALGNLPNQRERR